MATALKEKPITKEQIRTLYGIASKLGIVERGSHDDDYHTLIYAKTGKTSTAELTQSEYFDLLRRLRGDLTHSTRIAEPSETPDKTGAMRKTGRALAPGGISASAEAYNGALEDVHSLTSITPAPPVPRGKMTREQIGKATKLMFLLEELSPSDIPYRKRLQGIIKYALQVDVPLKGDMFSWLTYSQGNQLIECLKGLLDTARRKKQGGGR